MGDVLHHAALPDDAHKDLRCCKKCKLIKTAQQVKICYDILECWHARMTSSSGAWYREVNFLELGEILLSPLCDPAVRGWGM